MNALSKGQEKIKIRELCKKTHGLPSTDGDGVRLTRMIGSNQINTVDPFLLLDSFETDQRNDYIGGFPDHPHRGFETVTYLLSGRMRHKDNNGHEGIIGPGDIQWMTAGRGIIHSEMPEQEDGLLRGFQLWINLPSNAKMIAPSYQEHPSSSIPTEKLSTGGKIRVIAGQTDQGTIGPVNNIYTDPIYLDVKLSPNEKFSQRIPETHSSFIYVIAGDIYVGQDKQILDNRSLGILDDGDELFLSANEIGAHILVVAGKRLNEPVERSGPFVMNTRHEILQAYKDYEQGRF